MSPLPPNPSLLHWTVGLLLAGLLLAALTAVEGLGMLTIFLAPVCLYLSWLACVAGWPLLPGSPWRWLLLAVTTVVAYALVFWMMQGGYLRSALVCGAELLLVLVWRHWRGKPGRWLAPAVAGLWLAVALVGLWQGDLSRAVRDNELLWTRALLLTGADPNQTTTTGITGIPLLHEALSADASPELISALLRHGADVNGRWLREDGSLVMPAAHAFPTRMRGAQASAVLRVLLEAGLNPCQRDQHGRSFRQSTTRDDLTLTAAAEAALAQAERRHGCR